MMRLGIVFRFGEGRIVSSCWGRPLRDIGDIDAHEQCNRSARFTSIPEGSLPIAKSQPWVYGAVEADLLQIGFS